MSGAYDIIEPPLQGNITTMAVSTTASSATDTGVTAATGSKRFLFVATTDVWIKFHATSGAEFTVPSSTATSGDTQAFQLAAGTYFRWTVSPKARYFRAIAGSSGYLHYYRE